MKNKKAASVAPRERVNIVYKSSEGEGNKKVELPLRTLILTDLTKIPDNTPVEEREFINIDNKNFNKVLDKMGVGLNATITNKLSEEPEATLGVELKFNSMKDFNPDNIAQQVPELKKLLNIRDSLVSLKGPVGNMPDLRRKIQEVVNSKEKSTELLEYIKNSNEE